jgi:hypothetical protein
MPRFCRAAFWHVQTDKGGDFPTRVDGGLKRRNSGGER